MCALVYAVPVGVCLTFTIRSASSYSPVAAIIVAHALDSNSRLVAFRQMCWIGIGFLPLGVLVLIAENRPYTYAGMAVDASAITGYILLWLAGKMIYERESAKAQSITP